MTTVAKPRFRARVADQVMRIDLSPHQTGGVRSRSTQGSSGAPAYRERVSTGPSLAALSGRCGLEVPMVCDSISLHPFAPPALPGFPATMGALTPAGQHINRSECQQVSLLACTKLPTIPPSTTPCRPGVLVWFSHPGLPRAAASQDGAPPFLGRCVTWASPLPSRLAATTGRIRFVIILRTGRSPPVALHPASRRRSYLWLRSSDQTSTGTCTPLFRHGHRRTRSGFRA
jgi:hypothetical protein